VGIPESFAKSITKKFDAIVKHIRDTIDPDHPLDSLSLSDLTIHAKDFFEHDVSLTRYDTLTPQIKGDNVRSPDLINGMLSLARANATLGVSDEQLFISYPDVAQWRRERYDQEVELAKLKRTQGGGEHRKVDYGLKVQIVGAGECMLLLEVLGRDGKLNVKDATSILINERFPSHWRPPKALSSMKLFTSLSKCAVQYYMPNRFLGWLAGSHVMMQRTWDWAMGNGECFECEAEGKAAMEEDDDVVMI